MQLKSLSSALVLMPLLAYLTLTPAGAAPKAPEFKIKGSQVNVTTGVTAEIESQLKLAGGITKVVVKDIADADLEKIVAIFPNVDEFTIEESKQITSLKPLAALGKLTKLSVVTPNVADVTPLAGLTGLTKLALNSKMQDLKWMSQLTRLNQITLNSGDLVSLEGLPELTNLKNLDIYNAHPQDLGILAKVVPNLTNLKLTGCVIDDLTPLTGLGKLNYLSLYGVTVTDFTPLSKMPALKTLNYYATKGSNYDTLGTLTQVTKFEGGLTKLADIAFLKNLPNLKSMVLFAEYVRDYGPLADTKLEYLKIWSMHEAIDLVPVGKIGTLKELVFWSPENCTGSKELTGLKSLQKIIQGILLWQIVL